MSKLFKAVAPEGNIASIEDPKLTKALDTFKRKMSQALRSMTFRERFERETKLNPKLSRRECRLRAGGRTRARQ